MLKLDNTYSLLPPQFYKEYEFEAFKKPELIIYNQELANELGIDIQADHALYFSGEKLLPNSKPIALAYAGHQFGNFVPQLGDGRACLLGEIKNKDIQLKGSGATFFSRGGDGKSPLGPVLREYLISEYMHKIGIPTTRSLAAISTGEDVYREETLPGAILTRVASSHIRIGTFEFFASRRDKENLQILADYTINRHYSDINDHENKYLELFRLYTIKLSELVGQWMSAGFIHGVMNTDNMAISGETIDYGPCAFMDHFSYNQVYSYIDRRGRYAYNNQINIAKWNLSRFAGALIPLISDDEEEAVKILESEFEKFDTVFEDKYLIEMMKKFNQEVSEDSHQKIKEFLDNLEAKELDFTNSFYELNNANPRVIPRNHLIERAIDEANEGDFTFFHKLHEVLSNPFEKHDDIFLEPPKANEIVQNTFCGT